MGMRVDIVTLFPEGGTVPAGWDASIIAGSKAGYIETTATRSGTIP